MKTTSLLMTLAVLGAACGTELPPPEARPVQTAMASLTQVTSFGSNPGGLAMYQYVPARLRATQVPLVIALHGCSQTASDYQSAGWNEVADELGVLVVYPESRASMNCFAWWDASQARRDMGQALSIKQMIDTMKAKYPVGEVFITGLSAGGAMVVAMLASYPELFSAASVIAGIPYRCADSSADMATCIFSGKSQSAAAWGDLVRSAAPPQGRFPRIALWQGAQDPMVNPSNLAQLTAQWTNVHGVAQTPSSTDSVGPATRKRFATGGDTLVEVWSVGGMGHGTAVDPAHACGRKGSFFLDVGLCSSRYSASFFGILAGPASDAGTPGATDAGTGGPSDAGTTPSADAGVDTGVDASSPGGTSCQEWFANNYAHTQAKRAVLCQPMNGHVCTSGTNQDLGLWSIATTSWVHAPRPDFYAAGRCP